MNRRTDVWAWLYESGELKEEATRLAVCAAAHSRGTMMSTHSKYPITETHTRKFVLRRSGFMCMHQLHEQVHVKEIT